MPTFSSASPPVVAVVGGGLAGLAAATALSEASFRVVLLEARAELGGRATSYVDAQSGEIIDNCQHVSMGCCTNLKHWCRSLGLEDAFSIETVLYFVGPSGTVTRFAADPLPAPLHLARAFARLPYLDWHDKKLFGQGMRTLAAATPDSLAGLSFDDWLRQQGQSDKLIRNVWEVILVSALSESLDRIDARYARKVFVDGFLSTRTGWQVEIPTISLTELYSRRAADALRRRSVDIQLQTRVSGWSMDGSQISEIHRTQTQSIPVDDVVLALPPHQAAPLLASHPSLQELGERADRFEYSPISSVHLWYDRPINNLPHAVLVGRLSQWLFDRGRCSFSGKDSHLYQVVVSASRVLAGQKSEEIIERVRRELAEIWPEAEKAELHHARLITEKRAVFSPLPGIDALRPAQQTPVANLQIAGDWTRTGWPATMEGAVRSGYLAAENVLRRHERYRPMVQPDLPSGRLAGWLLKLPSGDRNSHDR